MGFSTKQSAVANIALDSADTLSNKTLDSSTIIEAGADLQTPAIIDPTRSDVKTDTQTNLETYAASAEDGQLCFATDTKLMYQIVDNALTEVGGGSSGVNYIENGDFNVDVAGVLSGNVTPNPFTITQ